MTQTKDREGIITVVVILQKGNIVTYKVHTSKVQSLISKPVYFPIRNISSLVYYIA